MDGSGRKKFNGAQSRPMRKARLKFRVESMLRVAPRSNRERERVVRRCWGLRREVA
jgi:hypothetical protein